jgi:hypothetical protein
MKKNTTIDRRDFVALTSIVGLGAMALNTCTKALAEENKEVPADVQQLKTWLDSLMKGFENVGEEGNCIGILEGCGKDCAQSHQIEGFAKKLRADASSGELDALVESVNKGIPGTHLEREGDTLLFRYDKCFCSIRNAGWVSHAEFCNCTVGWNKTFFTALLEKPVEAKLEKSIGKGDSCCLVRITV